MMPFFRETIGLIGIDTGHKTTRSPVKLRATGGETEFDVRVNAGVSIVAPVWKIAEVLDDRTLAGDLGRIISGPVPA
jgi:hypothetical protein